MDQDSEVVKPVHENDFMMETKKNIMEITATNSEMPKIQVDLCKERLGDVKNQLLETVKSRWIRPDQRNSICSDASSKRDRDDDSVAEKSSRPRTSLYPL